MKRIVLLLFQVALGCAERPQDASNAEHSREQAGPTPPSQGQEPRGTVRSQEDNSRLVEGGVLQEKFEYVLCLSDPRTPDATTVVLRRKGAGILSRFYDFRLLDFVNLEAGEEISARLRSCDPSGIIYEDRSRSSYFLRRAPLKETLPLPARILAAFVGRSTGIPVLYDSRTGFANRPVSVAASEEVLDVERGKGLLAKGGMPLNEMSMEDGRRFYSWTSSSGSEGAAKDEKTSVEPALLISKDQFDPTQGKVFISEGMIPLVHLLAFVGEKTGLPIYTTIEASSIRARQVLIITEIAEADERVVEKLLELNGLLLTRKTLPAAGEAIVIRGR